MSYNDVYNDKRLQAWEYRLALYDAEIKIPVSPYLNNEEIMRPKWKSAFLLFLQDIIYQCR